MRTRSLLITVSAAVALSVVLPTAAQAKTKEYIDRSLFDGTPERAAASLYLEGPTAGPLGGAMAVTVSAPDGVLPTTFGACENVKVSAVVTVSPGEVLTVRTRGEACAHIVDGSLTVNAYFDKKDLKYSGTAHQKAKVVGDGLIAVADHWYGGQASFSSLVRW